jgi:hypothetical protein
MKTWKLPSDCNKEKLCYKIGNCEDCNKAKKAYEDSKKKVVK